MNMKSGMICLLILAILAASVPSVVAAQTCKLATETHNTYKYTTDQQAQPTNIVLEILDKYGNPVSQAAPTQSYTIVGVLYWGDASAAPMSNTMGGARINFYLSTDGGNTWNSKPFWTLKTESGGQFNGFFKLGESGLFRGTTLSYKATYDGDISDTYPCSSNVVSVTIV